MDSSEIASPDGSGSIAPDFPGASFPAGDKLPNRNRTLLRMEITESALVPPEYLAAYHAVDPELARKVIEHNLKAQDLYIQELLKQQAHERELEKDLAKHEQKMEASDQKIATEDQLVSRKLQYRGQWIATAITLCGLGVVALALFTGHETAATWLGCSMVVALAGVTFAVRLLPSRAEPVSPATPTDPPE